MALKPSSRRNATALQPILQRRASVVDVNDSRYDLTLSGEQETSITESSRFDKICRCRSPSYVLGLSTLQNDTV